MRDKRTERHKKSPNRFSNFLAILGFVATIVGIVFGFYLSRHSDEINQKGFAGLYDVIRNLFPNTRATVSPIPPPTPSPSPSPPPPEAWVTVNEPPNSPLEMDVGQYAYTDAVDNSLIHVPVRLRVLNNSWKVFASLGLQGWTLGTTRGGHCTIAGDRLDPLPVYDGDYATHTNLMPAIGATSPLKIMVTGHCDQAVDNQEQFELAARINYFPDGDPNGLARLNSVTFNSNPIPVQ
jgi:hypothetical protein